MTTTSSFTITCPGHDPASSSRSHRWVDHLGTTSRRPLPNADRVRKTPRAATTQTPPRPIGPEEHNGRGAQWPASVGRAQCPTSTTAADSSLLPRNHSRPLNIHRLKRRRGRQVQLRARHVTRGFVAGKLQKRSRSEGSTAGSQVCRSTSSTHAVAGSNETCKRPFIERGRTYIERGRTCIEPGRTPPIAVLRGHGTRAANVT